MPPKTENKRPAGEGGEADALIVDAPKRMRGVGLDWAAIKSYISQEDMSEEFDEGNLLFGALICRKNETVHTYKCCYHKEGCRKMWRLIYSRTSSLVKLEGLNEHTNHDSGSNEDQYEGEHGLSNAQKEIVRYCQKEGMKTRPKAIVLHFKGLQQEGGQVEVPNVKKLRAFLAYEKMKANRPDTTSLSSSAISSASWNEEMKKQLVDIMKIQVAKGNFVKYEFSRSAWKTIQQDFCKESGLKYSNNQITSQFAQLKKKYGILTTLRKQPGFSWDSLIQMATAAPAVWDEHIKAHPEAKEFRSKSFPLYNDLDDMFGGVIPEDDPYANMSTLADVVQQVMASANRRSTGFGPTKKAKIDNTDNILQILQQMQAKQDLQNDAKEALAIFDSMPTSSTNPLDVSDRVFIKSELNKEDGARLFVNMKQDERELYITALLIGRTTPTPVRD